MRKITALISICLFLFQNLSGQTHPFDYNTDIQELINQYLDLPENEIHDFSLLSEEQKLDLFYKMIAYPRKKNEGYFKLFHWFLEEFPESALRKAEVPPLEYALLSEEEISARLIFEHTGKIPQTVLIPYKCDYVQASSLYMASEMKDYLLIKDMIDYGIEADSFCYQFWLEEAGRPESFVFFSKFNDTSYYDEDGKNILDYFIPSDEEFRMDIPIVKEYNDNYVKLNEKILLHDNDGITALYDRFMPLHLKHGAKKHEYYPYDDKRKKKYYYTSKKIEQLLSLSVIMTNLPMIEKLDTLGPSDLMHFLIDDGFSIYITEEIQDWLIREDVLSYMGIEMRSSKNTFFPVFLIANNIKLEKNSGNTRDFLLNGGTVETLADYYASKQIKSPEIFQKAARRNKDAVMQYLEANQNPFVADKYGLTLFELLAFSGMEKPLLKICNENKFLPLEQECLALALLGHNPKIMETLSKKVTMNDYKTYLYHSAIAAHDKDAVQWLVTNGYSAGDCLSSFDNTYEALRLMGDTDILEQLLKAGLKNHEWESGYHFSVFLEESNWRKRTSVMEFAIANHFDEAVELMYPYFYPENKNPEISLLSMAALSGTPRIVAFLMEKGLSANATDTTFENVSPIEVATFLGKTEIVKTMVEQGADYTLKPQNFLESPLSGRENNYSLADISGSLSTLNYLQNKGCLFFPELDEQIDIDIECRMDDRVKERLHKHPELPVAPYMRSAMYTNNKNLGIWFLENYKFEINKLCHRAIMDKQDWFFEYCLQNPDLKDSLMNYRNKEGNTLLHIAINMKYIEMAETLLNNGFDPNESNNKGYSPYYLLLQMESFPEQKALVSLMETHSASAHFSQEVIDNGFLDALGKWDIDQIHQFLKMGADPNQEAIIGTGYWPRTYDTVPAIYSTLIAKNGTVAEMLLLYGANPNIKNEKFETPLLAALDNSAYNASRMLIYKGADMDYIPKKKDDYSCEEQIPLSERISMLRIPLPMSKIEVQEEPVDSAVVRIVKEDDIKALDAQLKRIEEEGLYFQRSVLRKAVIQAGSPKMLKYVIGKEHIDIDGKSEQLRFLCQLVGKKRLDLLLSLPDAYYSGIDLSLSDYNNPLRYAVSLGDRLFSFYTVNETIGLGKKDCDTTQKTRDLAVKIIDLLATRTKGFNDSVYFQNAIENRFYEAFEYFMENPKKMTPERRAMLNILNHDTPALEKQLDQGLSPDAAVYGFPLITCAAWTNNTKAALLLLNKGADVSFSNYTKNYSPPDYIRPIMWGLMLGNREIVYALTNKGADLYALAFDDISHGSTAITMLMVQKDKRDWFKELLDNKVIDYSTGNNAFTLMTQAISIDDPKLVELLLHYPPDDVYYDNLRDVSYYAPKDFNTCVSYAAQKGATKVFFSLTKDKDVSELSLREYDIRFCNDIDILNWLVDNGYPLGDVETHRSILERAVENNDNKLFYKIYALMEPEFDEILLQNESAFRSIADDIFKQDNIELLKFLMDKGLTYKDEYLEKAIKEDKKDFISYFLVDLSADWIVRGRYDITFAPDFSTNYDTWEYTVKLIEGLIK